MSNALLIVIYYIGRKNGFCISVSIKTFLIHHTEAQRHGDKRIIP